MAVTWSLSQSGLSVWHCWQALKSFLTGLITRWSETLLAPTIVYGIWQSAHAAPAFQWTLLLENSSNSGWRIKAILKPVTPCFHSLYDSSLLSFLMMFSIEILPHLLPSQGNMTFIECISGFFWTI